MKALITGASSGIGYDISKYLSKLGYDIIAVGRNRERLEALKAEIDTDIQIITADLSIKKNCISLYKQIRSQKIDILINNAGFGLLGEFYKTDLNKELEMINTNIVAVHILTKLFVRDMIKRNKGYIMNVASIAGFMPGPFMSTYYSTKAYVLRFSQALSRELKRKNSKVSISVLCPGPVNTRFNKTANSKFSMRQLSSSYVAKYAIDNLLKNKLIIVPGLDIKLVRFLCKLSPDNLTSEFVSYIQRKKYS